MVRGQSMSAKRGRLVRCDRFERAADRFRRAALQPLHQLVDDLGDHDARGFLGLVRHHAAQRDQVGDEIHVRLDGGEEFGLEQHLPQALALEGILLDHLHHGGGEEFADIAQPLRDARRRAAEAAAALLRRVIAVAVERRQRIRHAAVAVGQRKAALGIGIDTERERPAALAFVGLAHRGRSGVSGVRSPAPDASARSRRRPRSGDSPWRRRRGVRTAHPSAAAARAVERREDAAEQRQVAR